MIKIKKLSKTTLRAITLQRAIQKRSNTKNEAMTKIKKLSKTTLRATTIAIAKLEER